MDVDLPASTVSLHGHELHYVTAGSGPVLVLLHGLLGSRQGWTHLMSVPARISR
jgi:pimeloyl-ACP methyl ester carboxylesterase